jgi:hypothetical protein
VQALGPHRGNARRRHLRRSAASRPLGFFDQDTNEPAAPPRSRPTSSVRPDGRRARPAGAFPQRPRRLRAQARDRVARAHGLALSIVNPMTGHVSVLPPLTGVRDTHR